MPANTPRGYTYPTYGDLANFPAEMQDFATDVDTDVAALVARQTAALNRPSARVSASANQSIPQNVDTFLTWAVEEYDNNAMANLGVNNDRISFPQTGIYLVQSEFVFTANGNATVNGRKAMFAPGLSSDKGHHSLRGSQTQDVEMSIIMLYQVSTPGDFIRVSVRQESGAALNVSVRSFSATKVAD